MKRVLKTTLKILLYCQCQCCGLIVPVECRNRFKTIVSKSIIRAAEQPFVFIDLALCGVHLPKF